MSTTSKRWFYTYHVNYGTVSIFQTSEYGPEQGYPTKKEALSAAVKGVYKELEEVSGKVFHYSNKLPKLTEEYNRLIGELLIESKQSPEVAK
jgi:hypothetical protein